MHQFAPPLLAIEDVDRATREQMDKSKKDEDDRRKRVAKVALNEARLLQRTRRRLTATDSAESCSSTMSDGEFASSDVPTGRDFCSSRCCVIQ